jgi:hypothetical protein
MGRSTLQTLPPTRPGCSRLPDARHRRRPGGVGAEPPTCFRDSEHTGPCRTRGRGAEPPGAQRQPNLPTQHAGLVLLLSVSQSNLPNQPAGYVLLLSTLPKLRSQPIENVLLLTTFVFCPFLVFVLFLGPFLVLLGPMLVSAGGGWAAALGRVGRLGALGGTSRGACAGGLGDRPGRGADPGGRAVARRPARPDGRERARQQHLDQAW